MLMPAGMTIFGVALVPRPSRCIIVSATPIELGELLARAREIAEGLAKLPPLTTHYTRIALTQKLRRLIDEGVGYGLALEGISAADIAQARPK